MPDKIYARNYGTPHSISEGVPINYWLTSSGEVVRTEPYNVNSQNTISEFIYRIMLDSTGVEIKTRAINSNDVFEIYVSHWKYRNLSNVLSSVYSFDPYVIKTKVERGKIFLFYGPNTTGKNNPNTFDLYYAINSSYSYSDWDFLIETKNEETTYHSGKINPNAGKFVADPFWTYNDHFESKNIIIFYMNKKVFYYNNYWDRLVYSLSPNNEGNYWTEERTNPYGGTFIRKHTESFAQPPIEITELEGAIIDNNRLVKVGLSGNIYYDLIPEFINNEWIITPYVSGTYIAPPTTTITFQPINR
jgi:hypothetical protein